MMMVLMKEVVILIMTVSPASKDPKNEEGNAQPPSWRQAAVPTRWPGRSLPIWELVLLCISD